MKTILTVILSVMISCFASSQTIRTTISDQSVGRTYAEFYQAEKNDIVTYHVGITFQNNGFTDIRDVKTIRFNLPEDIVEFKRFNASLLESYWMISSSLNIEWEGNTWSLQLYDYNNLLYMCYEEDYSRGYTSMNQRQVLKIYKFLKSIE